LNLYGPTEAAVFSTAHRFDPKNPYDLATVPIGKLFHGLSCVVVDDTGKAVEHEAEVGELLLAGKQVAAGYWNNDDATGNAFVRRTYGSDEAIWYRTGDFVSYNQRYGLLFHGRRDHQVKIGGYRVDLLEVERAIMQVAACDRVAIVPRVLADKRCDALVAFCSKLERPEAEVKAACAAILPPHMVPRRFTELRTLPLNANGKVDYTSLRLLAESLLRY
jgi:acyl-coenzyme A synthetase/AMP-(fatty) acid ligase